MTGINIATFPKFFKYCHELMDARCPITVTDLIRVYQENFPEGYVALNGREITLYFRTEGEYELFLLKWL